MSRVKTQYEDDEHRIGVAIAEGYQRIPQSTLDEWGDLSEQNRRSNREMLDRLDAEERATGFGPWTT